MGRAGRRGYHPPQQTGAVARSAEEFSLAQPGGDRSLRDDKAWASRRKRLSKPNRQRCAATALRVQTDVIDGEVGDRPERPREDAELRVGERRFVDRLLHAFGVAQRRAPELSSAATARGVVCDHDGVSVKPGEVGEVEVELKLLEAHAHDTAVRGIPDDAVAQSMASACPASSDSYASTASDSSARVVRVARPGATISLPIAS